MYLFLSNNVVHVPAAVHEYVQMIKMSLPSSHRSGSTATGSNVTGIYSIVTYYHWLYSFFY